jgi:hypothetical protein
MPACTILLESGTPMESSAIQEVWVHKRYSEISHHGKECCATALSWFLAMDRSLRLHPTSMPVWIRERWEWGPSSWPIHWCELGEADKLDCGALAAITRRALLARGVIALPCQSILEYTPDTIAHWREGWRAAHRTPDWTSERHVYHETVGIVEHGKVRIWDPTENAWMPSEGSLSDGRPLRIKVSRDSVGPELSSVLWGKMSLALEEWCLFLI